MPVLHLDKYPDVFNPVLARPGIEVRHAGSNSPANIPITLTGRRQDLMETAPAREITGQRVAFASGHWGFRARVPAGQYVESIVNLRGAPRRSVRAGHATAGWVCDIEVEVKRRGEIPNSPRSGR
ncbi:MAG: hypothetical protein ACR2NN_09035 [Bryobacteraceae bacterium]